MDPLILVTNKLYNNSKYRLFRANREKMHAIDGARTRDLRFIGNKNYD